MDNGQPLPSAALSRLSWGAALAQALLVAAGLRHHLVWGESARLPFLLPLLNAGEAACVVGFVLLASRSWWRGMALVERHPPPPGALLRRSLPMLAVAVLVPPFLSMDAIDYVMRGRVLALHGGNPYVQVANDFPLDPFLAYGDAPWKAFPLPYGPVVANLQGAVAWLAHWGGGLPRPGELIVAIVLFKLVFAACLVASALVARSIAAVLHPRREDRWFVAILWNPLLLNECVANCHNEAVLLLCLLLALRAAVQLRTGTGVFALGVGVLTKIVPVVLAPLLFVHALRHRRIGAFALGAVALGGLGAVFWWQFFRAEGSLQFLQRQSAQSASSLLWGAERALGVVDAGSLLWPGRLGVVLLVGAGCWQLWRRPEPRVLLQQAAVGLAALVAFGLTLFGPWYHVWWVPIALLLGRGYLHRAACIASVAAPLGYLVWTGWRRLDEPHQWTTLCLCLLVPAIGGLLWREPPALIDGSAAAG